MSALEWLGLGAAVFAAAAIYDLAAARYVRAAARSDARAAMGWSVLCATVGLVGILGIVSVSPWLVIPEIVGVACGTYLGIRWRHVPPS